MLEHYDIDTLEQLRAVSDMLRIRILDLLRERPMTVTQLGELLGMAPAKVHYHVRELEKVGLLRLVETREKGGILEKYYQPVARNIEVAKGLLLSAPPDELVSTIRRWFEQIRTNFLHSLRRMLEQKVEKPPVAFGFSRVYITYEEQMQLCKQVTELLKQYETRRGIEGEQEILSTFVMSPQEAPLPTPSPITASSPLDVKVDDTVSIVTSASPVANTWTVGTVHYDRAGLEKTRSEGKRLNINVVGVCLFDEDVSAELVERAIEQFNLVGKLQAPAPVREVLLRKRTSA